MKTKFIIFCTLVTLTSLLLTACGVGQGTATPAPAASENLVVAEGHIKPKADANLSFGVRGHVQEILVSEGQKVSKGDALLRLQGLEQAQAALAAAQLAQTTAQQEYDAFMRTEKLSNAEAEKAYHEAQVARAAAQLEWEKIDPNDLQDEVDNAQTEVRDAQKALDDANEDLAKYLDLKSDNPTRRLAEADQRKAEADYNTALRKVEDFQRKMNIPRAALDAALTAEAEAKRTYELGKDGPNPEKKALVEAQLNNAKAQAAAAQDSLNNYELKAPFDGIITDINTKLNELIGTEKYAIQIADLSAWYIETSDLSELEVVRIKEGQKVNIEPDALPGLILKGTVESISQGYTVQGGDVLYSVKIKLDGSNDARLRWGMTVQTTFNP